MVKKIYEFLRKYKQFSPLILTLAAFFIILSLNFPFSANGVIIEVMPGNCESDYQIFYDMGNGYNEDDSVKVPVVPVGDGVVKFKFNLPSFNIKKLRIDPGTKENISPIKSIIFYKENSFYRFEAKDIVREFHPLNHIEDFYEKDDLLYIKTSGCDPFFEYEGKELTSATSVAIEFFSTEYKDICQIFYDVGNGYNENDSVKKSFVIKNGFLKITFPLPDGNIKKIRIDPAAGEEKSAVIKSISFETEKASYKFYPRDIGRNFYPLNHIEDFYEKDNLLYIKFAGNDPSFEYLNSINSIKASLVFVTLIVTALLIIYFNLIVNLIAIIFKLAREIIIFIYKKSALYLNDLILCYEKSRVYEILKDCEFVPEKLFVLFAAFFGLSFIIIVPPFQGPDEFVHFKLAFKISEFDIFLEHKNGNSIASFPDSLIALENPYNCIPFNQESKCQLEPLCFLEKLHPEPGSEVPFSFLAPSVSPVCYIPQAMGIYTARMINMPVLLVFYFARLFNLIFFIIIIYFTIRITPVFKWLFFLLALMPMTLTLGASLSYDVVTIISSFLFISILLKVSFESNMTNRTFVFILFVSLILSLSKGGAYFLLLFLFFFIPVQKAGTSRKYYLFFFLLLFINLTVFFGWNFCVYKYSGQLTSYGGVNITSEQIKHILYYPFHYIKVLINTLFNFSGFYLETFVGKPGWLDTELPPLLINMYLLVLVFTALIEFKKDIFIGRNRKIFLAFIFTVMFLVLETVFYIFYTAITLGKVGHETVLGIQGRYFIPFSPLLFFLFYNNKFSEKLQPFKKLFSLFFVIFSFFSMIITLLVLLERYYSL